jgi:hypothetical protein
MLWALFRIDVGLFVAFVVHGADQRGRPTDPSGSADCSMTARLADNRMKPAEAPEGGDALSKIFRLGRLAFAEGKSPAASPFIRGSASANAWLSGWHAAKRMKLFTLAEA